MTADNPDAVIDIVMRAARVRRAVEAELRPHGISFALWWVLYVTDWLSRQAQDAVSQEEIVLATELDKSTVSYLMRVLSDRGLVDRGPDGLSWAWRIWPTDKGTRLLSASFAALGSPGLEPPPGTPPPLLNTASQNRKSTFEFQQGSLREREPIPVTFLTAE